MMHNTTAKSVANTVSLRLGELPILETKSVYKYSVMPTKFTDTASELGGTVQLKAMLSDVKLSTWQS